jgi:hypothetical protein
LVGLGVYLARRRRLKVSASSAFLPMRRYAALFPLRSLFTAFTSSIAPSRTTTANRYRLGGSFTPSTSAVLSVIFYTSSPFQWFSYRYSITLVLSSRCAPYSLPSPTLLSGSFPSDAPLRPVATVALPIHCLHLLSSWSPGAHLVGVGGTLQPLRSLFTAFTSSPHGRLVLTW